MVTTPYVRIVRPFNYRDKREHWRIAIGEREFDGIETNYTTQHMLTPDWARYVATELWKLAEEIDGKQEKNSKAALVRESTEKIIAEARKEFE